MDRVLVLGCAGAGKSTLARKLAQKTGLPLIHLDRHYWLPGWVEIDRIEWQREVQALAAEPRWILDGNYGSTLPLRLRAADTAIYLDMPRRLCLWRVLYRICAHFGCSRPDMAEGCPERFNWDFLKYIWNYRRTHRPRLLEALRNFDGTVHVFETPAQVEAFLRD